MHRLFLFIFITLVCTISGFFFFTSCTQDPVQTDLLLPVDFSNVPDNMVLIDFHTDKIEIKIQADPRILEKINQKDFRYAVDLYTALEFDPAGDTESIEPGGYLIPVEKKRIPLNSKMTILSMDPSYLSVKLDKKIRKKFKIAVPYTGVPPTGYMVLEAATEPSHAELEGASSTINAIEQLKTKPIDLTNIHESFKKNIPLDIDNLSITSRPANIVMVTIPVQERLIEKTIDLPVKVLNAESKAIVEPAHINIKVKGPFETLSSKEIIAGIHSFIDIDRLKPGVYARHAYIEIPVGMVMTDADPKVFTIKID